MGDGDDVITEDFRHEELRRFVVDPDAYLRGTAQLDVRRRILRHMVPSVEGLTLVDIGCGDGSVSAQFVAQVQRLVLLDRSATMLERAKDRIQPDATSKVEFVHGSLEQFQSEPADVVLCIGVLAYVPDVGDALRRVSELTKADGRVIVQFTDSASWCGAAFRGYFRLRGCLGKPSLLNGTSFDSVTTSAASVGLSPVDCVRHWPLVPGMGRLPEKLQHRYLMSTSGAGEGPGRGSETYVLFRKR